MSDSDEYTPPRVWHWDSENGGRFANINRPTAGAQFKEELPVGEHPMQLYSLGTPNGVKATVMLEELLERGEKAAPSTMPGSSTSRRANSSPRASLASIPTLKSRH